MPDSVKLTLLISACNRAWKSMLLARLNQAGQYLSEYVKNKVCVATKILAVDAYPSIFIIMALIFLAPDFSPYTYFPRRAPALEFPTISSATQLRLRPDHLVIFFNG